MDRACRQNTRRRVVAEMEQFSPAARGGGICRRFINGSCRYGSRCNYRHERPVIPSSQICRYFQKGGCWYGERCRYLHILQPEGDTAAAGRRGSAPTVSPSSATRAPLDRRGSEPALLQAEVMLRRGRGQTRLVTISNPPYDTGGRAAAADVAEAPSQDAVPHPPAPQEVVQSSEEAQAGACDGRKENPSTETENTGVAAASSLLGKEEQEAFLQSKDMTCGICMDKVYEKTDPRKQMFGILPNCSHSFCLQCIRTWRKTKDLGPDVIKTCPQCRVRSAFYVPNKYWVEGQAKDSLVAAFKEKFSGKSCLYYTQYRCCPFKTECLYRHDKSTRRGSFAYCTEDDDDDDDYDNEDYEGVDLLNFFIAMALLSGDDDDEFDFPLYLAEEYSF
ncbi:makorin, ring finger protein, 4 [Aulostomus maculatus]